MINGKFHYAVISPNRDVYELWAEKLLPIAGRLSHKGCRTETDREVYFFIDPKQDECHIVGHSFDGLLLLEGYSKNPHFDKPYLLTCMRPSV